MPAVQSWHAEPAVEYLPDVQVIEQESEPVLEDLPAAQFWHPKGEPATEYFPAVQIVHADVAPPPAIEEEPAAQF